MKIKISQQPQIIPSTQDLLHSILVQKDLSKFMAKTKSHDEIKLVYFGTPEFSAYILEQFIQFCQSSTSHSESVIKQNIPRSYVKMFIVQAVVTGPDKAVGRKQIITPSPVSMMAQKYNIPVFKPARLDEDFIKNHQSYLECDLFVVVSYGQMLPKTILDIPRLGAINVHASLLPKYRGASPIQQAILNGDKETGVAIMLMDKELDHGPILATKRISIYKEDNFETLSNKLAQLGAKFLIETLSKFIEGKITPHGQNHAIASFCQRLTRKSGYFDINPPAGGPPSPEVLDRMIRAYYPWPGVWTRWNGKIVKLLPFIRHPEPLSCHPERLAKDLLRMQDASNKLRDSSATPQNDKFLIQMEGKKVMPLADFLNGYPDFPLKGITLDKK